MSQELPIDMTHPAVRDYLALIRLQVLTPLSLLINIASVIICGTVVAPTLGDISSNLYITSITPQEGMIATFVIFLFLCQVGYCILLVLARKDETKATLVKGVGVSLVVANWIMALWAISWKLQVWLLSTILLGALIIVLAYANIVLLIYHTPVAARPLDTLFIHVPLRLFLLLPLNQLFWQSLFVTLGWYWKLGEPDRYDNYAWPGFIVVFTANILALVVVCLRHDIVWCVGAAWLDAALWSKRPKSVEVYATAVTFTVVLPMGLMFSWVARRLWSARQQRPIQLPPDEEAVVIRE